MTELIKNRLVTLYSDEISGVTEEIENEKLFSYAANSRSEYLMHTNNISNLEEYLLTLKILLKTVNR